MNRSTNLFIVIVCILYVAICCYFSPFVRGSDQFWYVEEVESLSNFYGKAVTNNIFPASLPAIDTQLPRPWVQNRPVIYLVYLFYIAIHNSNLSWVLFNCFCVIATALLVLKIMRIAVSDRRYSLIFCLFLFFPFNFYLVTQPLCEIFNMLLVAVVMYALLNMKKNIGSIIVASACSGLLIWQRDNYILLLLFLPFFIVNRKQKYTIIYLSVFFVITGTMLLIRQRLFPNHLIRPLTLMDNMLNVSSKSNMTNYFQTYHIKYTLGETVKILANKLATNIAIQFKYNGFSSLFFYVLDIMMIPFIILLFKSKFKRRDVLLAAIFILIHFATVALFQNQYRYASVIVPGLFLSVFWLMNYTKNLSVKKLSITVITLFIVLSLVIGVKNRKEAIASNLNIKNLQPYRSFVKNDAVLMPFDGGNSLYLSYVFSPNLAYYFLPDEKYENIKSAANRLNTNYCIVAKNTPAYDNIRSYIISEKDLPVPGDLSLVTIKR